MSTATFFILPIFILLLILPLLLGVYVYRDARRRSMNAALWTLVVILTPALLGFIIYLLVRSSYSDLACPGCRASIKEQYTTCPHCGTKLKNTCKQCDFPLESGWKVCPQCAAPIEVDEYSHIHTIKKEDSSLTKLLLLIIAVPLTLFMLLIVVFSQTASSASMTTAHVSPKDYAGHPAISAWLSECDKNPEQTYALAYLAQENGKKISAYLIYRPAAENATDISVTPSRGFFKDSLDVYFVEGDEPTEKSTDLELEYGYVLTMVSCSSDEYLDELNIYVNDEPIECEIADVEYNVELFRLSSE
ncbi:MAG: zinc ribbon domain-containing protein [Lachnospiraceae bacterium]|nr:zinc ribbon domain-containing protein [Lachnospiraceae bacterium]